MEPATYFQKELSQALARSRDSGVERYDHEAGLWITASKTWTSQTGYAEHSTYNADVYVF